MDYPGKICAIVFLQGCNFRCPFCHNPELVDPALFGTIIPEEDVLAFLERRRGRLDGVVITGGEPTLHRDLKAFLQRIKYMGFLVKLDTNGAFPSALRDILPSGCVDYIAMDIKGPLERYPELTGTRPDTEAVQESIALIKASGIDYEFRTTLVCSLLSPADVLAVAPLIEGARRYALQRFVPSKHVQADFVSSASFTPPELEMLCAQLRPLVGECIVR